MHRVVGLALFSVVLHASLGVGDEPTTTDVPAVSYFRDVRPILQQTCQGCHQPARRDGGFAVTAVGEVLATGDSGVAGVVPGKPDESYLVERIAGDEPEMPPEGDPLTAEQVELIRLWIKQGAADDSPASVQPQIDAEHPPQYTAPPVITSLDFSPDGKRLAVSGYHEVLVYSLPDAKLLSRLVGLSERIESAVFSPDGNRLAVTGGSPGRLGEVQIWEVETGELLVSRAVTYDTLYGAAWSSDGKLVSFGCGDTTLRAIDAATGEEALYQGAHDDFVLDTVFSVDNAHLVSVSRDRSMKLVEVATHRFIDNITSITPGALKGGLMAVDRHPTKNELLIGGADGTPKIYRMFREKARKIGDDFNLIRKFDALPGRVYAVDFNADGTQILAASSRDGRGELRIYQAADAKLLQTYESPDGGLYAAVFHPDGETVAVGGFDGVVRLIDVASGEVKTEFPAMPTQPTE